MRDVARERIANVFFLAFTLSGASVMKFLLAADNRNTLIFVCSCLVTSMMVDLYGMYNDAP